MAAFLISGGATSSVDDTLQAGWHGRKRLLHVPRGDFGLANILELLGQRNGVSFYGPRQKRNVSKALRFFCEARASQAEVNVGWWTITCNEEKTWRKSRPAHACTERRARGLCEGFF